MLKILLPNTSYITNYYDNMARMKFTRLNNSSHTTLDKMEYGYNAGNQRITMTNSVNRSTNQYDNIGQLTVVDSSSNTEDRGYKYDAAWNLSYRTNNGTLGTFGVDGKNQLTSSPESSWYQYDGNGNLNARDAGADYFYFYDNENRLETIDFTFGFNVHFVYDGLGRLREKSSWVWSEEFWDYIYEGSVRYIYDGMRVVQERDGDSSLPMVSYTRGSDLSGSLEGAGGIGGMLSRTAHTGTYATNLTHAYYHADGNGNITYLVTSGQGLAASYRYDAYGNTLSSSGSLVMANTYRFSSKMVEPNSGLYYYGYRWYAPGLQRWLNRDPIQEQAGHSTKKQLRLQARAGWNLYTYCLNEPMNVSDTDGRGFWGGVKHAGSVILTSLGGGGTCCNKGKRDTWYVDDGEWKRLPAGECTGTFTDCDGMMCGGSFWSISTLGTMGCDDNCQVLNSSLSSDPVKMDIPNDRIRTQPPKDWTWGTIAW